MRTESLAPIVLFVYNRPWHTLKTLKAIKANELASESRLYIFCDGPKFGDAPEKLAKIKEVRDVIRQEQWCREVIIEEREDNLGLAKSITQGVTSIVNEFGKIIVLEDDLVTNPHFLKYMNAALELYQDKEYVACISGYIYPVEDSLPDSFFMVGAECWGWATWKRAWSIYDADGSKLLFALKKQRLTRKFDFQNSMNFTDMLQRQIAGLNDSWCIRWYASAFLKNKLCLYPGKSLVRNIGMDGSGTHCQASNAAPESISGDAIRIFPSDIKENKEARKKVTNYFFSVNPHSRFKIFLTGMIPPALLRAYRSFRKKEKPR